MIRAATLSLTTLALLALAGEAHAQDRIFRAGLQVGGGVSFGQGGNADLVVRPTPTFLDVEVRTWSSEEPTLSLGGVLRLEVGQGRVGGAMVPRASYRRLIGTREVRVFAGLPYFFAPYTMLGAELGAGGRIDLGPGFGLVFNVMSSLFFVGSDVPDGGAIVMVNATVGIELGVRP
ncbi:MAG: hypothetical protein AAF447_21585 [Myxococcota bacterium]